MSTALHIPSKQESDGSLRKGHVTLLVGCLLALLAGQAVWSMQRKSVTTDEIMYIAAGYYHLKTGDFQMNMTNTPLMKLLAATPLLLLQPTLPPLETHPQDWSVIRQWQYAHAFLYDNRVDADRMLFVARLPIVLIALVLGLFVFRWSNALYGPWAGVFALFLYSFSPNVLAHARLATHDLGLTAFMFIATYYFWRYVKRPALRPLLLCGVFTGLALLTKTTAIFLAPIFGGYLLVGVLRRNGLGVYERFPWVGRLSADRMRGRQVLSGTFSLAVIGLITLFVLNAGYGFQGTFTSLDARPHQREQVNAPAQGSIRQQLKQIPLPAPTPFVKMVRSQSRLVASGGSVYFAGKLYPGSTWYMTLVTFLLKTPIPLMILLIAAGVGFLRRPRTLESEWLLLIFVVVVVVVFSFLVKVNANVRYVLSIYPCLYVLASGLMRPGVVRPKWTWGLMGVLSLWYLISSVNVHPHYLAYFNESMGGPKHGYKFLADSNLDWGQDLKGLGEYMEREGIDKVRLGYFGSADAAYYGVDYEFLPSVGLAPKEPGQLWWYEMSEAAPSIEPEAGVYAISANLIASPAWMTRRFYDAYAWFRQHEPVDQVGYSILIYNIE